MPIPRMVARWNRVGLNRVVRRVAPWLPGFGVIVHRGRKSGREFRTPVNVFFRDGFYVIALTYGKDSDWVRNVLAAGGCDLVHRRRTVGLVSPMIEHDDDGHGLPLVVRGILGLIDVTDYLVARPVPPGCAGSPRRSA